MRTLLLALVSFVLLVGLGTQTAHAQDLRRYYDWHTTLYPQTTVLGLQVYAQEASASASTSTGPAPVPVSSPEEFDQFNRYVIGGDFTPKNRFYFLKTFQENWQLTFTFNPLEKDKLRLELCGERLAEIQQLTSSNDPKVLGKAVENYKAAMARTVQEIQKHSGEQRDMKEILEKLETETTKHTLILEETAATVLESDQATIEQAIKASWAGPDTAADINNKPSVPEELVDRLEALKAQGLLTEEETTKVINTEDRSDAREELASFVDEGIVPEADFLRMNEHLMDVYPKEFNSLVELKKFYELKELETEKPDEATLKRIQEFAKVYKPGEVIPSDIRRFWAPVIRLEELQNTFRPDLIDEDVIKNRNQDFQKYNEIVERYKPRPEDVAFVESYLRKNPNAPLPPEYERMRALGNRYGAQCGTSMKWFQPKESNGQYGGYCAPENQGDVDIAAGSQAKSCKTDVINSAKGPNGVCSVFYTDCLPSGWSKVNSCAAAYNDPAAASAKALNCPNNTHFVPIAYSPDGGYCVPNYTQSSQNSGENLCPVGYHRNYQGGACLPDYNPNGQPYLAPLSNNNGQYPSPYYPPNVQSCPSGQYWYQPPGATMGGYCRSSSAGNYTPTPSSGSGSSGNTMTREQQEATCKGGGGTCDWGSGVCNCRGYAGTTGACTPPGGTCGSDATWDQASCSCKASSGNHYSCPSYYAWNGSSCQPIGSCSAPTSGCAAGTSWNSSSCACQSTSSGSSTSCPSGQYWTGSSCAANPTTAPTAFVPTAAPYVDPYEACINSGGRWAGGQCYFN